MPLLYGWEMRRRIYQLYGQLEFLEAELERREPEPDREALSAQLDHLEKQPEQKTGSRDSTTQFFYRRFQKDGALTQGFVFFSGQGRA
jgi:hypothetical protein